MHPRSAPHPSGIEVIGLHRHWARVVVMRMHLSVAPRPSWLELFSRGEGMPPLDDRLAPTVDGPSLVFHTTDATLEADVLAIETRVHRTNAAFQIREQTRNHPPSEPVRKFADTIDIQESASPEMLAVLASTQRRASALSDVFQSAVWEVESEAPDDRK